MDDTAALLAAIEDHLVDIEAHLRRQNELLVALGQMVENHLIDRDT